MLFTILLIVCPNKAKNERAFAMAFLMTEKDDENFGSSTECWIFHSIYVDSYVKVRDHCRITGEYRCSAQ